MIFLIFMCEDDNLQTYLKTKFLTFSSLALALQLCSNNGENSSFTDTHSRLDLAFIDLSHVLFKVKQLIIAGT